MSPSPSIIIINTTHLSLPCRYWRYETRGSGPIPPPAFDPSSRLPPPAASYKAPYPPFDHNQDHLRPPLYHQIVAIAASRSRATSMKCRGRELRVGTLEFIVDKLWITAPPRKPNPAAGVSLVQ